jgi:hypothetical protein
MMCQICRFSLRVNFPGSEFLFWRQSGFLGKFAVSNFQVALLPDGKNATGKLATNSCLFRIKMNKHLSHTFNLSA